LTISIFSFKLTMLILDKIVVYYPNID